MCRVKKCSIFVDAAPTAAPTETPPGPGGCGGVITQDGAVIKSPNHPNNYDNNADCEWVVQYPAGKKVSLNFAAFSLEGHNTCG